MTPGMRRNGRRVVVGLAVLAVLAAGGGFAIFELTSGDAPPPPTLSADDRGFAGVAAGEWRVRPARGAFAGYRVDEKYLGVGVRTAVGRTPAVTGTLRVTSGRIEQAALAADLTRLRSDQTGRDDALRGRGIEPPSVAGLVTVRDHGALEFRLIATHA